MELLRALAMPFQAASLLFVALTSLVLGFVLGRASLMLALLGIFALWVTLVWLMRYAYQLLEAAADGLHAAPVADTDMLNPLGDPRCWVHPCVTLALVMVHVLQPTWPVWPTLLGATLLFPPSIAATVLSGRARDAFNPRAIVEVVQGLGVAYWLVVLAVAGLAALGVLLARQLSPGWLLFALLELLLLLALAVIGAALHARRIALGFAARVSPERSEEKATQERDIRRQAMLDGVYQCLRVRESGRALSTLRAWLDAGDPLRHWPGDVQALLAAGRQWNEPREWPRLLAELVPQLVARHQPALATAAAESGLAADPGFVAGDAAVTEAVVAHAAQSGRRRVAARLLENFLRTRPAGSPPEGRLAALRESLQGFV